MANNLKLSFVIPAYNEAAGIGKCLESIIRETRGKEDITEIIVVNNASTDNTHVVAAGYKGVHVVDEMRKGIVFARAAGYAAARGELIANVDADTMLTPGWIDTVLAEFAKNKNLVTLSGPFIYYDLPQISRFFVRFFYYITYIIYILTRFIFHVGSVVQGGNFVVRRDALEKIGGYDTSIAFYGEDTDVARRMSKVGDVKFTFKLPMFTSGRRLAKEGVLTTAFRYTFNYFWVILLGAPLSKKYSDLRPAGAADGAQLKTAQEAKSREWVLGILVGLVIAIILVGLGYGVYWIVLFIRG